MKYKHITLTIKEKVACLVFSRPEVYNAINNEFLEELIDATSRVSSDDQLGALIITGKGKAFCSGGDISTFAGGDGTSNLEILLSSFYTWIYRIVNMDKPVIAGVNGYAYGAGFSVALFCDLIIAAEEARFSLSFVNVGAVPDGGAAYFLPRIIGLPYAKELAFTGGQINAQEAKELRIINKVVPGEKLLEESMSLAQKLASGPRLAHGYAKRLFNQTINLSLEDFLEQERLAQINCFKTDDHHEAVRAFLEKRKPQFKGR